MNEWMNEMYWIYRCGINWRGHRTWRWCTVNHWITFLWRQAKDKAMILQSVLLQPQMQHPSYCLLFSEQEVIHHNIINAICFATCLDSRQDFWNVSNVVTPSHDLHGIVVSHARFSARVLHEKTIRIIGCTSANLESLADTPVYHFLGPWAQTSRYVLHCAEVYQLPAVRWVHVANILEQCAW